jgi:hypothetical protein
MKTALDLLDMAQKINREMLAEGFTEKEIIQACELCYNANRVIVMYAPLSMATLDKAIA